MSVRLIVGLVFCASGFLAQPGQVDAQETCTGDCNGDGTVAINEVITCVNIGLELLPLENCSACDANDDGIVTINEIITRCIPGNQVIGYHFPHSVVPGQYAQLPVVGFVRNPWDWYVSWYAFNRRPKAVNPLFSICSDGGKADFKTTVKNLVNLGEDSVRTGQYRDALISIFPDNLIGNRGVGLTKACLENFKDNETAYCSWLFVRMLGLADQENVHIGHFENLGSDFVKILSRLDVPQIAGIKSALQQVRPINSSSHSHYSHYYDDELRELINHKDGYLIKRFDYSFEQEHEVSKLIIFPETNTVDGAFRKLLDKEQNYLPLCTDFDVDPILRKLEQIPDEQWTQSDRESKYKVQGRAGPQG